MMIGVLDVERPNLAGKRYGVGQRGLLSRTRLGTSPSDEWGIKSGGPTGQTSDDPGEGRSS